MSRKVLDTNVSDAEVNTIMDNIIAQNPQLNAQIEQVHNENNIFLCKLLRVYPYEDKAYVKLLNNDKNIFCRLSHEVLGSGMSIDYLPNGVEKQDFVNFDGKKYIEPFDDLYGVVGKVRWFNLDDENVLLGYVNVYDDYDLKSDSDTGEISIKSGSSILSVDDERVNIMTPSLFINGLPYDEPELQNYYDKTETDIITNTLTESINQVDSRIDNLTIGNFDLSDYVKKSDVDLKFNLESNGYVTIGINVGDGF